MKLRRHRIIGTVSSVQTDGGLVVVGKLNRRGMKLLKRKRRQWIPRWLRRHNWTPFDADGQLRDLEAEGWHHTGAIKDEGTQ